MFKTPDFLKPVLASVLLTSGVPDLSNTRNFEGFVDVAQAVRDGVLDGNVAVAEGRDEKTKKKLIKQINARLDNLHGDVRHLILYYKDKNYIPSTLEELDVSNLTNLLHFLMQGDLFNALKGYQLTIASNHYAQSLHQEAFDEWGDDTWDRFINDIEFTNDALIAEMYHVIFEGKESNLAIVIKEYEQLLLPQVIVGRLYRTIINTYANVTEGYVKREWDMIRMRHREAFTEIDTAFKNTNYLHWCELLYQVISTEGVFRSYLEQPIHLNVPQTYVLNIPENIVLDGKDFEQVSQTPLDLLKTDLIKITNNNIELVNRVIELVESDSQKSNHDIVSVISLLPEDQRILAEDRLLVFLPELDKYFAIKRITEYSQRDQNIINIFIELINGDFEEFDKFVTFYITLNPDKQDRLRALLVGTKLGKELTKIAVKSFLTDTSGTINNELYILISEAIDDNEDKNWENVYQEIAKINASSEIINIDLLNKIIGAYRSESSKSSSRNVKLAFNSTQSLGLGLTLQPESHPNDFTPLLSYTSKFNLINTARSTGSIIFKLAIPPANEITPAEMADFERIYLSLAVGPQYGFDLTDRASINLFVAPGLIGVRNEGTVYDPKKDWPFEYLPALSSGIILTYNREGLDPYLELSFCVPFDDGDIRNLRCAAVTGGVTF